MPQAVALLAAFLVGALLGLLGGRALNARGRSVMRYGSGASSAMLTRSARQPSPSELEDWQRAYALHRSIERSALSRVIGVGASQTIDGTIVEFISIELRASGGRALLRIRSVRGFTAQTNALERPAEPAPPTVKDDVGTGYAASWGARNGGGDDDYTEVTAEFLFAPNPPPSAHELTVSIPRSLAFASRLDVREDPWIFVTPLQP